MTTHRAKQGDSLQDLVVRCYDRDGEPMDLTNASDVTIYMREVGAATNKFSGLCEIEAAREGESYPSRVRGPNSSAALDEPGTYSCYLKATYPTKTKRMPSNGFFSVEVEPNFEG